MSRLLFHYDDGGRAAAGYRGKARDCATRAIAIATGRSYEDIYRALAGQAAPQEGRLLGRPLCLIPPPATVLHRSLRASAGS